MIRYDHYTDKFVKVSDRECPWCKAVCASTDKYCHECGWHIADTPQTDCEDVWRAGNKTGYDKGFRDAQKVKDSQDLVKDLVKAFGEDGTWLERQGVYMLTLAEAKQRAVDIIESVLAKDEPTTQTETQNSNSTFEKDECVKEYEELGLKELKELIEADRKTEPQLTPNYCGTCKHREVPCGGLPCDVCHGYSNYEPKDEPQTERSE